MRALIPLLLAAVAGLSACTSDDTLRLDGTTIGAGNAIAANTVMQMVDPWPHGVENPRLRTPAVRKRPIVASGDEPVAPSTTKE